MTNKHTSRTSCHSGPSAVSCSGQSNCLTRIRTLIRFWSRYAPQNDNSGFVHCQLSIACPPKPWRRRVNRPGLTLIELLLFMGLFSIFLIILTDLFTAIVDVRSESEATSNVQQDGRFILSRLAYDISRADSITSPALGATANSLSIVISGTTYTYQINSNNFQLTNNFGANNLNGSETTIPNLQFQRIGNIGGKDTIKIIFTVNSVAQRTEGPETKTFQTTIGRR